MIDINCYVYDKDDNHGAADFLKKAGRFVGEFVYLCAPICDKCF